MYGFMVMVAVTFALVGGLRGIAPRADGPAAPGGTQDVGTGGEYEVVDCSIANDFCAP